MKAYLTFFKIRFINGLQYRAAALGGIATQFAWGAMNLLCFKAFYDAGASNFPMEFRQLSSYIWLQQALMALFMAWYTDNDIISAIQNGNICYELCHPMDIYYMWFTKNMAVRVSKVILRCFPILIVASLLPEPYRMSLPASPLAGVLFLVSLVVGFLLMVSFSMLIHISAFYTISTTGIKVLAISLLEFLSGFIIPLPFFPDSMQKVLMLLPFASTQNTPYQLYVGTIRAEEALGAILLQFIWLAVFTAFGWLLVKKALKRVVVQGG